MNIIWMFISRLHIITNKRASCQCVQTRQKKPNRNWLRCSVKYHHINKEWRGNPFHLRSLLFRRARSSLSMGPSIHSLDWYVISLSFLVITFSCCMLLHDLDFWLTMSATSYCQHLILNSVLVHRSWFILGMVSSLLVRKMNWLYLWWTSSKRQSENSIKQKVRLLH